MEIKLANPQGKGRERISDALQILQELQIEHKTPIQILRDYCCSLLVLASDFSFLPVPNRNYFLFLSGEKFKLSPISPKEWGDSRFGEYIAKCRLETDMTWSGTWRHDLEDFPALNEKIRDHIKNFLEMFRMILNYEIVYLIITTLLFHKIQKKHIWRLKDLARFQTLISNPSTMHLAD